jgi:valyl-tRNA synthetase
VNQAFEQHRYHEVAETLYHFFWHDLCDWYLEIKKLRLAENSGMTNDWANLLSVFAESLRLLHPIMPFQTEELWHRLGRTDSISLQPYPGAGVPDEAAEKEMSLIQEIIGSARMLRANFNLDKSRQLEGVLYGSNGVAHSHKAVVEKLTNLKLDIRPERPGKLEGAVRSTPDFDLLIALPTADTKTQRNRLEKEVQQYEKLVADKDRQLSNDKFLQSAPAHVIESLRSKRAEYQAQLEKSRAALDGVR